MPDCLQHLLHLVRYTSTSYTTVQQLNQLDSIAPSKYMAKKQTKPNQNTLWTSTVLLHPSLGKYDPEPYPFHMWKWGYCTFPSPVSLGPNHTRSHMLVSGCYISSQSLTYLQSIPLFKKFANVCYTVTDLSERNVSWNLFLVGVSRGLSPISTWLLISAQVMILRS